MNTSAIKNPASKTALRHWKGQRYTAALIVVYALLILLQLIFNKSPLGYELWAGIFSPVWMRLLTVAVVLAIAWHAWLGMCEIFMDYIKPANLKRGLHVFTALWLAASVAWFVSVLLKF